MAIEYGVSWEDYKRIEMMSPSTLKHGLKSMRHLKRGIDGKLQPDPKTVAVGNAAHCLLADEFDDRYVVMPRFELDEKNVTIKGAVPKNPKGTGYYQASVEHWREFIQGDREEITQDQLKVAEMIINRVQYRAGHLIRKSKQEVTVTGSIGGVNVKTRLDGLCLEGDHIVWDLKTTSDISDHAFFRIFDRMGYGFSATCHIELLKQNGVRIDEYLIIAAEAEGDFDCRIMTVPEAVWVNALDRVVQVCEQYKQCLESNQWPGLPDAQMHYSNWSMTEHNKDLQELQEEY